MISYSEENGALEVVVNVASFDASNAASIKERFRELSEIKPAKPVRVDLSAVDFIDSSGIGALLSLFKATNQNLTLVKPKPAVVSVLELLRLHRVFPIEAE
ncbi:MAG: STAS domain-containing protein [Opitutales bacterium]|nr:STAS domain-containing protein [Opitutales bacterium]